MRQEILFLLLMGRELMVKPGGWGGGWQRKDPRPRGSRTTVPRAFPGVGILLDDITRKEREDRVVVGLVRRFAIDFPI